MDSTLVADGDRSPQTLARLVEAMRNTPGVTYILEVEEHPLCPLDEIVEKDLCANARPSTDVLEKSVAIAQTFDKQGLFLTKGSLSYWAKKGRAHEGL